MRISGTECLTGAYRWPSDLNNNDLAWTANRASMYTRSVQMLPYVFSWQESAEMLNAFKALRLSNGIARFASSLRFIEGYAPHVASQMREAFEALTPATKEVFLTSPEVFDQITHLRRDPVTAVHTLCIFLKAEFVKHNAAETSTPLWSAIGDFQILPTALSEGAPVVELAALVGDQVVVDWHSPNAERSLATSAHRDASLYEEPDRVADIVTKLRDACRRIEEVNVSAAELVRTFTRVIIPLKTPSGSGSTSQIRFPGRVLLRGLDRQTVGSVANALIHESMHQLMYILEFAGSFITGSLNRSFVPTARSAWSGRDLPLPSFIHACFVWYGLAQFWLDDKTKEFFNEDEREYELNRCMKGFSGSNPADALLPHASCVRLDVLEVAASLQEQLRANHHARAILNDMQANSVVQAVVA